MELTQPLNDFFPFSIIIAEDWGKTAEKPQSSTPDNPNQEQKNFLPFARGQSNPRKHSPHRGGLFKKSEQANKPSEGRGNPTQSKEANQPQSQPSGSSKDYSKLNRRHSERGNRGRYPRKTGDRGRSHQTQSYSYEHYIPTQQYTLAEQFKTSEQLNPQQTQQFTLAEQFKSPDREKTSSPQYTPKHRFMLSEQYKTPEQFQPSEQFRVLEQFQRTDQHQHTEQFQHTDQLRQTKQFMTSNNPEHFQHSAPYYQSPEPYVPYREQHDPLQYSHESQFLPYRREYTQPEFKYREPSYSSAIGDQRTESQRQIHFPELRLRDQMPQSETEQTPKQYNLMQDYLSHPFQSQPKQDIPESSFSSQFSGPPQKIEYSGDPFQSMKQDRWPSENFPVFSVESSFPSLNLDSGHKNPNRNRDSAPVQSKHTKSGPFKMSTGFNRKKIITQDEMEIKSIRRPDKKNKFDRELTGLASKPEFQPRDLQISQKCHLFANHFQLLSEESALHFQYSVSFSPACEPRFCKILFQSLANELPNHILSHMSLFTTVSLGLETGQVLTFQVPYKSNTYTIKIKNLKDDTKRGPITSFASLHLWNLIRLKMLSYLGLKGKTKQYLTQPTKSITRLAKQII